MFKNRTIAGKQLAQELQDYQNCSEEVIILAIPRGGVPVGKALAQELNVLLDIAFAKKITHPVHKEFAIGAVSLESRTVDSDIEVPDWYIEAETKKIRNLIRHRFAQYYKGRKPLSWTGKTVIIVDDGVATGHTLLSTIDLVQKHHPQRIIVAIPVGPEDTIERLKNHEAIDKVVCLSVPDDFVAVGGFYSDFHQLTDQEVIDLLNTRSRGELT